MKNYKCTTTEGEDILKLNEDTQLKIDFDNVQNKLEDMVTIGNKLIAIFMGAKTLNETSMLQNPLLSLNMIHPLKNNNIEEYVSITQLKYHKSWDWLMPVVENIENLKFGEHEYFTLNLINTLNPFIESSTGEEILSISFYVESKIEATWRVVVDFIKWYNKNIKIEKLNNLNWLYQSIGTQLLIDWYNQQKDTQLKIDFDNVQIINKEPLYHLTWDPKKDITAFELANCIPIISLIKSHTTLPSEFINVNKPFMKHFIIKEII